MIVVIMIMEILLGMDALVSSCPVSCEAASRRDETSILRREALWTYSGDLLAWNSSNHSQELCKITTSSISLVRDRCFCLFRNNRFNGGQVSRDCIGYLALFLNSQLHQLLLLITLTPCRKGFGWHRIEYQT